MPQQLNVYGSDIFDAGRNMAKLLKAVVFDLHVTGIATTEPIAIQMFIAKRQTCIADVRQRLEPGVEIAVTPVYVTVRGD